MNYRVAKKPNAGGSDRLKTASNVTERKQTRRCKSGRGSSYIINCQNFQPDRQIIISV